MSQTRACAANLVAEVLKGFAMPSEIPWQFPLEADRAFVKALANETLRHLPRLEIYLKQLLKKPLPPKENQIKALLCVGLCQLDILATPPHAAISETVNACVILKKIWAKNLVNAILRQFQRDASRLRELALQTPEGNYLHQNSWITKLQMQYPNDWETILLENNTQAPLFLRINLQKISREDYLTALNDDDIFATPFSENACGIILQDSLPVSELPFFSQGWVSVQDGAAQKVFDFLDLKPGLRFLDACAAPGGKLLHVLESGVALETVVAIDQSAARLERVKHNCERMGVFPHAFHATDACDLNAWWDGKPFDRILLDAPCSGSGVVRRHPDIKILKKEVDIQAIRVRQMALLKALFATLAPGGLLLYCTCSVFQEENDGLIEEFIATEKTARTEKLDWSVGLRLKHGIQVLPGVLEMDGFYYSCLRK